MKKNVFLEELKKIFEKNKILENDSLSKLDFDSLKILVFLPLRVTSVFEKYIFYGRNRHHPWSFI